MSNPSHGAGKPPQSAPQQPAYTLPGVINYLTSEFTNLERYKILNSLEKSEMKRKINELQGELNSLRYIDERQRRQITHLKQENELLKAKLMKSNGNLSSSDAAKKGSATNDSAVASQGSNSLDNLLDPFTISSQIPEINLLAIKDSREHLNKAISEIFYLLRTPSPHTFNYLGLDDPAPSSANTAPVVDLETGSMLDLGTGKAENGGPPFEELFSNSKEVQLAPEESDILSRSLNAANTVNSDASNDDNTTEAGGNFKFPTNLKETTGEEILSVTLTNVKQKKQKQLSKNPVSKNLQEPPVSDPPVYDLDMTKKLFGEVMQMESKASVSSKTGQVRGFDDVENLESTSGDGNLNRSVSNISLESQDTLIYGDDDEFSFNGEEKGYTLSLATEKYPYVRVFDADDDLIPYVHYRTGNDVQLNFYSVSTAHSFFTCEALLSGGLPKDILLVQNLFLAIGIHQNIIVYKNGTIESITCDSTYGKGRLPGRILKKPIDPDFDGDLTALLSGSHELLKKPAGNKTNLLSATICKLESKSSMISNVHRLAIVVNEALEVYDILSDTNTIEIHDFGTWSRDFLLASREAILDEFEVVGWFLNKNEDEFGNLPSISPPLVESGSDIKSKNKSKSGSKNKHEPSNQSFGLLIQNGGYLIEFDVISETSDVVSTSYAKVQYPNELKLRFHGQHVIVVNKDHSNGDSYHCTLINLDNNSKKSAKLKFKQLILLEKGTDCQVITETRNGVSFYDLNLNKTKEMKKFGELLRVGENLLIKGDKKLQIID